MTYTEHLTALPLTVTMKGKFMVTPEQRHGHFSEPFRILSEHDACFWVFCSMIKLLDFIELSIFLGFLKCDCFSAHTDADMTFTSTGDGKNTKVIETVTFGSPPMMTWYYRKEHRTQRQYIAEQLQAMDFRNV